MTTLVKIPEVVQKPTNIDDLINGFKNPDREVTPIEKEESSDDKSTDDERASKKEDGDSGSSIETPQQEKVETQAEDKAETKIEAKAEEVKSETKSESDSNQDEYGNEVPKARTYSEEEVNQMMRERFKRTNQAQQQAQQPPQFQPTNQQVQQAAQNFTPDPNSGDTWEVQLKEFVKSTLTEVKADEQRKAWQAQENEKQLEFQAKFSTGMERYKDFKEVAGRMPITDSMMMATRDMKDPAAFIYAASKQQPKELERIAQLSDPFQQAAEVGRLEERMRKSRNVSKASTPLRASTSDVADKVQPKVSIDHMIGTHAKRKAAR